MSIVNHAKIVVMSAVMFCSMTGVSAAQQWTGPDSPDKTIWRSGSVAVGSQPTNRKDPGALLVLNRPLSGSADELLFSARSTFRDDTIPILQVDTKRVYVAGGASKVSLVPDGVYDLVVGRGVAIGAVRLTERLPTDYMLAVAGKVLAEEIRVKQVGEWSDYVFRADYPLRSLPALEGFIKANHHLPDIPSASEVERDGVSLGEMQSKLLLKIEELTLHLIAQHKTIDTLQRQLAQLEHSSGPRPPADHE